MVKDVSEYSCMEYVAPFWKGDAVYAESVFVLENALGEIRPFRLAYPVRKVISVRSADLRTTYEQNRDYRVNEYGELEIIRGGRIPYMEWKDYRFPVFDSTRDDCIASADALGAQLVGELFSDRRGFGHILLPSVTRMKRVQGTISRRGSRSALCASCVC